MTIKNKSKEEKYSLSKEQKFIKRTAMTFIILSFIALLFFLKMTLQSLTYFSLPDENDGINHYFLYIAKYLWIFSLLSISITSFSFFTSIKFYLLKSR